MGVLFHWPFGKHDKEGEEHEKDLKEMNQMEKKKFLSNDLTERMIRIEQHVSASFGDGVPYDKTEYYKSLPECEKKKFEKHLANKAKKRSWKWFLIFLPIFLWGLWNVEMTGNVVKNALGETATEVVENASVGGVWVGGVVLGAVFVIGIFLLLISAYSENRKNRKIKKHVKVLDNIVKSRW